jgi:hypothetical protein
MTGTEMVAGGAKAGAGPGGNATSPGGNLSGSTSAGVSATGANVKHGIPGANSDVSAVGNTLQQSLPIIFTGGYGAITGLIDDLEDIYDRIIVVSRAYYAEFREDAENWINNYKPFLAEKLVETAFRTLPYLGDGRGSITQDQNPDKDLFRRGQMAAAKIKDLCTAWHVKRRITDRYAHGAMRMDDIDITIKRLAAQVDNQLIAERIEDVREDEFNNRRWNRLIAAANIGVTGSNVASRGYSMALAQYTNAAQNYANYKAAMGNQIAATAGMFAQKAATAMGGE